MNSKKDFYLAIKEKLLAEVPKVKTMRLWNNQFDKEEVEKAFLYPAVFLEFLDMPYMTKGEGMQQTEFLFVLHIGWQSLKTEDLDVFDLIQEITNAFSLFSKGDLFSSIVRTREKQDSNHDAVIAWELEFTTVLTDNSGNANRRRTYMPDGIGQLETLREAEPPRLQIIVTNP